MEFVKYIKKALVVNKLNWHSIPGYDTLMDIFIDEIKIQKLGNIKQLILKTGNSLLEN